MLSHIIHDWDEQECLTILRNCRRAMSRDARLLLVDAVVPPGNDFHPSKFLDLVMLTVPGGQERTAQETALHAKAGFTLTNVVRPPHRRSALSKAGWRRSRPVLRNAARLRGNQNRQVTDTGLKPRPVPTAGLHDVAEFTAGSHSRC